MDRKRAIEVIEEIFETDSLGLFSTLSDEQIEAVQLALYTLKYPEKYACAGCKGFTDEDACGYGWCQIRDKYAGCDDYPCDGFAVAGTEEAGL